MKDSRTDAQLLERVKDSDVEAFRALFERYQPTLFRQVLFQTRQSDLSHDIVQESFVRVWKHRSSLKPHLSFLAYLLRISGNLVRDAVRHEKTRKRLEQDLPAPAPSEGDNPEDALRLSMLKDELVAIINRDLPERCREIFLMSRYEGKSHREIAELLGLSTKTVENQINHALKQIRRKISRYL